MAVKKTTVLQVIYSHHLPMETVIIHPSQGVEIGLMTKHHKVQWCMNLPVQDFLQGKNGSITLAYLDLQNNCPQSEVQMNISHGKEIGMPLKAVLLFDGRRIYLHPVAAKPA